MARRSSGPSRSAALAPVVITVMVIAFGIAGYALFYVSAKRDAQIQLTHRRLRATVADLEDRILQTSKHLSKVAGILTEPTVGVRAFSRRVELASNAIELIPGLRLDEERPEGHAAEIGGYLIQVDSGATWFRFSFPVQDQLPIGVHSEAAVFTESLAPLEVVDGLLLVAESGEIFHQTFGRNVGSAVGSAESTAPTIKHLNEFRVSGESIDPATLAGGSVNLPVELGDEPYVLFVHQVRPSVPGSLLLAGMQEQQPIDGFLLCGLVLASSLNRQSRALSPLLLLVLVLLVLVAVLLSPMFKVLLIGPRERYRKVDLVLLELSVLTTAVALYLAGSALLTAGSLNRQFDDLSLELGEEILDRLDQEMECARLQLVEFAGRYFGEGADGLNPNLPDGAVSTYPLLQMVFRVDTNGKQLNKWSVKSGVTPLIEIPDRYYFMVSSQSRPARPTFRSGRDGPGGAEERSGEAEERPGFGFEIIISRNTGEVLVALSIPWAGDGPALPGSTPPYEAATLITRPASLSDLTLPSGYLLLVVERDGKVLLNSGLKRYRMENLNEECGFRADLSEALLLRRSERLNLSYLEVQHRALVLPMGNQPYSLVVMRRTSSADAVLFMVLVGTVLPILAMLILLVLAVRLALPIISLKRLIPIWDGNPKTNHFQHGVLVALLALAVMMVVADIPGAPVKMVLLPILLVLTVWLTQYSIKGRIPLLRRLLPAPRHSGRIDRSTRRAYLTLAAVFSLALGVGTAAVFYQTSIEQGMELLTMHHQLSLGRAIMEQGGATRAMQIGEVPDCTRRASLSTYRATTMFSDHISGSGGGAGDPSGRPVLASDHDNSGQPDWLLRMAGVLLKKPDEYRSMIEELRHLGEDAPLTYDWHWRVGESRGLRVLELYPLPLDRAGAPDSVAVRIQSIVPAFPLHSDFLMRLLALLIVGGLVYLAVHFLIARVLGLKEGTLLRSLASEESPHPLQGGSFVVVPEPHDKEVQDILAPREGVHVLDLVEAPALLGDEGWRLFDRAGGQDIIIWHLETMLDSPEIYDWTVRQIQQLPAAVRARVRLVSQLPPERYVTLQQDKPKDAASRISPASMRRLVRTLEGFTVEWLPARTDYPGPIPFFHYFAHWLDCSIEERLVLLNIAREGVPNPKTWDTVKELRRRKLLPVGFPVSYSNDQFREFVRSMANDPDVQALESAHSGSGWAAIRGPLFAAVFVVAGFFLVTQRAQAVAVIGVISALSMLVPSLTRLKGFFSAVPE